MPKPIHMAGKVAPDGRVSPLCAKKPRAIDLNRATWTIRRDAVTCPRCRALAVAANERIETDTAALQATIVALAAIDRAAELAGEAQHG